jgi:hypothetical protein
VLGLAVALVIGLGLGVALDRVYLRYVSPGAAQSQAASARAKLVGQWVGVPHGEPLEFNADGTFAWEMAVFDMREGKGAVGGQRTLGQWRWLEDDWIEMDTFGRQGDKARVVIEGDKLKLLRSGGDVTEYRRK